MKATLLNNQISLGLEDYWVVLKSLLLSQSYINNVKPWSLFKSKSGLFVCLLLFVLFCFPCLCHSGLNEWSTMASPSVSVSLTLTKFLYLLFLFMLILSALLHKSVHFKQLGSKSWHCSSRSRECCASGMHWNSSYKYTKEPKGNLDPDANCSSLSL